MSDQNIFYVYAYLREDQTPYYIGKGSNNRAWKSHTRTNGTNLLPKDSEKIIILKGEMTESEAYDYETELIFKFGRKDLGTGILHNLTNGGRGNDSGYQHSDEAIEKLRIVGKRSAQERIDSGTHNFITNPPRANLGGKVTKKLVAEGKHNLLKRSDGTSVSSDRVKTGTHHFVDPLWKKEHGKKHAEWIRQQIENGDYYLISNNPAKTKVCCIVCQKETNPMGLSRFHQHNKENNE